MSLSLFYLQNNNCNLEIQPSYCGIGISPIKHIFLNLRESARSAIVKLYFICKQTREYNKHVKCKLSSVTFNNGQSKGEGDPISALKHAYLIREILKF